MGHIKTNSFRSFILSITLIISLDLKAQISCSDLFKATEPTKTAVQLLFEKVKIAEDDDISKIEADFVSRGGFKNESWIENELNFARFIRKATLLSNKNNHPTEIYGEENYKAFRSADEYLKSIPVGEFKLNDEVLQNTHRKAAEGVVSVLRKFYLQDLIPAGYLPTEAGAFKKRTSFGRDPLFYPISDKAVEALRSNPWLGDLAGQHGFYELPFLSKPNARRGFIIYANPKNLKSNLEKLYLQTQEKLSLTKEKKYSPSLLAAEVQLALVSLHPFVDGNGRTSRLIMDRVLKEVGLPPTLLENTSDDLYMTPKEWAFEIQKGLRTYVEIMNRVNSSEAPKIGGRAQINATTLSQILPSTIQIKGMNFQILKDGFLYNQKGIPFVYRNGVLYPITDKTYIIYQMSNKGMQVSTSYADVYNSNLELINKVSQDSQAGSSIKVIDYSHIIQPNKKGEVFLYDWQKPLIKDFLEINETDPVKVLKIFGRAQTSFEQSTNSNKLALILAQYEKLDHQLWTLKQQLKSYPEFDIQVEQAREKIFQAAKQLINAGLTSLKTELAENYDLMNKETAFQIFDMLYKKSKLSSDNYAAAVKNNDTKIYLLRSDSSLVESIGFRSQANYKELLKKIPGYKKLRSYLITLDTEYFNTRNESKKAEILKKWKEYAEKIKAGDSTAMKLFNQYLFSKLPEFYKQKLAPEAIEKTFTEVASLYHLFVERILMSKYQNRGILVEYEREFIDNHLQMIGSTPEKPGKSFSSNSNLYLERFSSASIPFTNDKSHNSIFLVEIDRSEISWNEYSVFSDEYEFVSNKYISSQRIVDQMTQERFKETISLSAEQLQKSQAAFSKYGFGASLTLKKESEATTELSKP